MRPTLPREAIARAEEIVEAVFQGGEEAALRYSAELDGAVPPRPLVEPAEAGGDPEAVEAAMEAARSLEALYARLVPQGAVDQYGGFVRYVRWVPVRSAALYVPARFISTLVMLAVPARVAGVEELYVVTPPRGLTPELLAVARRLGVKAVVALGGPHGLAYAVWRLGVDMVAGPGGLYVQAAKYVLSRHVGIDGIEGPTELAVYAEGVPAEVAMRGVLAQLEHGPASQAHILSPDEGLLREAEAIYARERTSSMGPLHVLKVSGVDEAVRVIDGLAPEHLEVWGPRRLAFAVRNAGAVSIGLPSPYLDYVAGICHVLPTGGSARWRGALTPHVFMKAIGMAEGEPEERLRRAAAALARYEGFPMHLKAVESASPSASKP